MHSEKQKEHRANFEEKQATVASTRIFPPPDLVAHEKGYVYILDILVRGRSFDRTGVPRDQSDELQQIAAQVRQSAAAKRLVEQWKTPTCAMECEEADDPTSILHRLSLDPMPRNHAELVCRMEFAEAGAEALTPLRSFLWSYIGRFRNSQRPNELIATGSAIRQFIRHAGEADLDRISDLLLPGGNAPIQPPLLLEIVRMIFRWFKANPPRTVAESEIADRLMAVSMAYLNPLILPHSLSPAIACTSIHALVAMRSKYAERLIREATQSTYRWLSIAVSDELVKLADDWGAKPEEHGEQSQWLRDLLLRAASNGG